MADIRIKDLATTAASTASDDFVAVDGSANGTRKLNAYSPTFGGNLTVSATTGTNSFASVLSVAGANIQTNRVVAVTGGTGNSYFDGASIVNNNVLVLGSSGSNYGFVSNVNATTWSLGYGATKTSTGTAALSWTDSGAVTLAGNLTVSGTGTSSVRGTWLVGTSAFSSVQSIAATLTDTYSLYRGTPDGTGFEHSRVLGGRDTSSASTYASFLAFYTEAKASGTTDTSTEKMRLLANGNLLLGTTVNSGALLQVGTNTTTSAGGMIFGTDTRLYRANAGQLYLDAPASTSGAFWVNGGSGNASASINLYPQGTGLAQVSAVGANSLLLRTNNTTALTLDSSQRCILAGALRLNNAYTAGAPTATGYVTLQDSAGNTYKVLVGT